MLRQPIYAVILVLVLALSASAAEFGEAPMLAERVADGDLPAVEERLPKNPFVVEPIEEIGRYGGTIRVAAGGDAHDMANVMTSFNSWLLPSPEIDELIPHLAEDVVASDDMKTFTFYLREGTKWSDGHPYTTDDVLFWYEDVLQNEDLPPVISSHWRPGGELMELEVIDDYTFEISLAKSQPYFLNLFVHQTPILPKHYLKQFHPHYVSTDELNEMAEDEGFAHWYELFGHKNYLGRHLALNPDLPTLTSYKLEVDSTERRVLVRNPYYWKVDSEGNQLPYTDRVDAARVTDAEVYTGMIISGALDFAGQEAEVANYPLYRQYEEEGNYRTILWDSGSSNEVIVMVNMNHENEALREVFQQKEFRQALSLGIDREEFNEVFYFGQGKPRQFTVLSTSKFFEPEFEQAYADYDLERANQLLDDIGLTERDGEGYRLLPNGDTLQFTIEMYRIGQVEAPKVELLTEQWSDLGLRVQMEEISGELQHQRAPANMMDANTWGGDKASDILFPINPQFVVPLAPSWEMSAWTEWARWLNEDGQSGEEPPQILKDIRGWWDEMIVEPERDRRIELGKKILEQQAENLWVIGLVGEAPIPLIFSKDLGNVPEEGLWVWDSLRLSGRHPEQLFFRE